MLTHSTWRASSTALVTSILFFCLAVSNRASKSIPPRLPVQNADQVRQPLLKTIYAAPSGVDSLNVNWYQNEGETACRIGKSSESAAAIARMDEMAWNAIYPRSATIAQDDDLAARYSLDHRDNAARLQFRGGEPLDVGEGSVTRIYAKVGERWASPTLLMTVKALVTYPIAHLRPSDPDTKTSEEEIQVKSTVKGTITNIAVHEGQVIHHNRLLLSIHPD
jgi:acetyl/propionyl-CoA carboxylase alpha subunit